MVCVTEEGGGGGVQESVKRWWSSRPLASQNTVGLSRGNRSLQCESGCEDLNKEESYWYIILLQVYIIHSHCTYNNLTGFMQIKNLINTHRLHILLTTYTTTTVTIHAHIL